MLIFEQVDLWLKAEDHSDEVLAIVTTAVREPFHDLFGSFNSVGDESRKSTVSAKSNQFQIMSQRNEKNGRDN